MAKLARKKKPRKPSPLYRWDGSCRTNISSELTAHISPHQLHHVDARRVAKWLLRFADWAEFQLEDLARRCDK